MAEIKLDIVADLNKLRKQMRTFFRNSFKVQMEGDGKGKGDKTAKDLTKTALSVAGIWAIIKSFQPILLFLKGIIGIAGIALIRIWQGLKPVFRTLGSFFGEGTGEVIPGTGGELEKAKKEELALWKK